VLAVGDDFVSSPVAMLVRQIRRGRKTAGRRDRIAETPWGGMCRQRNGHWRKISGRVIIPLVSAQEQILAVFARRKVVP
jgi:hypothetical protein